VPAGFTTSVYDRVPSSAADSPTGLQDGRHNPAPQLTGPIAAQLPVGIDFLARPFDEPLLLRIASAYEAATHQRVPPPDFGPVTGEASSAPAR
jgi:Asp-tRNA(Asn)/Glu-tRNA(Gln) amidotransferase A subunit family amidase